MKLKTQYLIIVVTLIILSAFFIAVPSIAQEPASTAEPATPPPVVVEIPDTGDGIPWSQVFNIALLIFVLVREWQARGHVSPEQVEKIIAAARTGAGATDTKIDDIAVDLGEAIAKVLLKNQAVSIQTTSTTSVTPE